MNFIQRIFGSKEKAEAMVVKADDTQHPDNLGTRRDVVVEDAFRYQNMLSMIDRLVHPSVVGNNFIQLFKTIPEVFWPIDFIAKRISEAHRLQAHP